MKLQVVIGGQESGRRAARLEGESREYTEEKKKLIPPIIFFIFVIIYFYLKGANIEITSVMDQVNVNCAQRCILIVVFSVFRLAGFVLL